MVLFDGSDDLEPVDPYGVEFLPIAKGILEAVAGFRKGRNGSFEPSPLILRESKISSLRIVDFIYSITVIGSGRFKKARADFKKRETTYRRNVKNIDIALGQKLLECRSVANLTEIGRAFALTARSIVIRLQRNRAFVPFDFDYGRLEVERIQRP